MLINIYTIIFQLINIAILYLFLKKYLFKPMGDFLEHRREKVQNQFEEAKRQYQEATSLQREYKEKLENAREEVRLLLKTAEDEAGELKTQWINQAKEEAEGIISKAASEIERAKNTATKELMQRTMDLALLAAAKILEENISSEQQHEIIQRAMGRIGENKWIP